MMMASRRQRLSAILGATLLLYTAHVMAQNKPATTTSAPTTQPTLDFPRMAADLNARAQWLKDEVNRLAAIVAEKPDTPRAMLKQRNGQMAKDPRPTPKQAIAAAKESTEAASRAVKQTIEVLARSKNDKAELTKSLMPARIYVNEFIEIALIQLKDTDEEVNTPAWISPAAQMTAAASAAVDAKMTESITEAWKAANPTGEKGLGVAGAGGRESVIHVLQGKTIAGLGEVISGKVSFRVSEVKEKWTITPTTANFTILVTGGATFGTTSVADKSLLERRLSLWFVRAPIPDINAADAPATKPSTAPATTRAK
jgi:hypothetical protein